MMTVNANHNIPSRRHPLQSLVDRCGYRGSYKSNFLLFCNFYKIAIEVWTIRDVSKRNIAKLNNLYWIEFFNLEDFNLWFKEKEW